MTVYGGPDVKYYTDPITSVGVDAAADGDLLRAFFEQRPVVTLLLDQVGTVWAANQTAYSFCDAPTHSLPGQLLWELPWRYDPALRQRPFRSAVVRAAQGENVSFEIELCDPSMAKVVVEFSLRIFSAPLPAVGRPKPSEGSAPWLIVMEGREVVSTNHERERQMLMDKIFESAAEAIIITDKGSVILDVNPAFTELTGYKRAEVIGKKPSVMQSGRHNSAFYQEMWKSLGEVGKWRGEVWDRRKDGQEFLKQLSITSVRFYNGTVSHYVGVFLDVTPLKKAEARLQHLAFHDPLTGLANRALFFDRLREALLARYRRGHDVGMLYIDLDAFKSINDDFGHQAGDAVLIETARRLCHAVRGCDTVARLGGDEFAIILDDLETHEAAESVALRVVELLSQAFPLQFQEVCLSASVGIAFACVGDEDNAAEVECMVRAADVAMYAAKAQGKNQYQVFAGGLALAQFATPVQNNVLNSKKLSMPMKCDIDHSRYRQD